MQELRAGQDEGLGKQGGSMSRPIIGSRYTGPSFDRPALRRLPTGTVLEEASKPLPAWWRLFTNPERIIFWLCMAILVFAALEAFGVFQLARAAEKPTFPKAEPFAPVWSIEDCKRRHMTYIAHQADGGKWRVHCVEPGKRIRI